MIEIDGVWKQYKLGNTVDLQRTFRETVMRQLKPRASHSPEASDTDTFWALRDINLSIQSGRTLGLIGHNGAGKSTLLKVLSRITQPTKGLITLHGSLSSLLEVGTGFHPELSGRENIYLYGAIMGMSRNDIQRKFDQIVDYAGIEQFLDTPVKRYSSGMYVRLAFSIAAHVEPDILVVDEVLAVGDKAFREKCLGKMDDVAQSGRTVIFVSHNMNAVASLCQDVAWLDRGQVQQVGAANNVINAYERSLASSQASDRAAMLLSGSLKTLTLESLSIQGHQDSYSVTLDRDQPLTITAHWRTSVPLKKLVINLLLYLNGTRLMTLDDVTQPSDVEVGTFSTEFTLPTAHFNNTELTIALGGQEHEHGLWCWMADVARVNIVGEGLGDAGHEDDALMPFGQGLRQF